MKRIHDRPNRCYDQVKLALESPPHKNQRAKVTTEPQKGSEESDKPMRRSAAVGSRGHWAWEPCRTETLPSDRDSPKPRETGRVFDNQGREVVSQVDKKGRLMVPKPALAPPKSGRSTAPRRPRAEPIICHSAAAWGVGGPGGGFVPPRRGEAPGERERRREADFREATTTDNLARVEGAGSQSPGRVLEPPRSHQTGPHHAAPLIAHLRDVSPSKGSEWSTTSEPLTKPKTPKKRASSTASSEAYWSDDSDTPVKPRALRRSGRVLSRDSFGARSLLSKSDPRSEAGSQESIYASSVYSYVDSEDESQTSAPNAEGQSQSAASNAEEEEIENPFPNPETWESQHDTRGIDPLKLGEISVRPLPPIAIHSTFKHSREAWGLPPLKLRCPLDSHRHPYHIYQWNTKKLNCYAEHESDCQLCGASCCSVMAYTKALAEDPRPNPVVPLKYRKAFQRDIDQINAMKPQATDPFERMLKCDTCYRNVCPDCAGRCMKPACLRIICKSCGDPDPWIYCQCEMYEGKLRITYI
ncbi:uncharacterized protein M437DRAFT_69643 [Aureobasidium melanogenum CBS 110374]|uniref:Uncharacterized protein n=1 Tax=Aureobasidium melanogenum (strain CBS 110374) TaxID=1043003 RepID=A0A074VM10_AURM1|nr:uncharacterized protein M437DRAFT_69643 [Aureobasidium melanogenum CBS 110374]KEQ58707.1 hypothetical protein M437DRAFT_69643 [Aureobasidium melanogenum CBS 110374]